MTPTLRLVATSLALLACTSPARSAPEAVQPSVWAAKPDVAAFDKSVDGRIAAAKALVRQLVAVKGKRTVENTLQPFDDAVREINTGAYLASVMESVHTDATFRDHATQALVRASSAQTEIQLDPKVYQALAAVDASQADAATQHYLKKILLKFRLAGVDKDEKTRAAIKKLEDEQTELVSMYDRNIADDKRSITVAPADLEGLPADFIAGHPPGADGKVTLTTAYTDAYPVASYMRNADVRRRLRIEFDNRGYPKNLAVLRDMLKNREQMARLLGYANWADYTAADQMIGSGANIGTFLDTVAGVARGPAEREYQMVLAEKRKTDPAATSLTSDELGFYNEAVRRTSYAFDSQSVRPYFPYDRVKQGIIDTASALFHVSFEREAAAPVWHPAVESWLVRDQGKVIGRIYLDMHPREGKYTHAAMFQILDGVAGKQLPEAVLICNFPQPTAQDPGLMTYSDVTTFFHEFGHLMHHVLGGHQRWAGISGITTEDDFGEAPSQMLEELIRSPALLASFAKHYQTNEPIPRELVERMNRASAFGRGMSTQRQLQLAATSYDLHRLPADGIDPDAVWAATAKRHVLVPVIPGTHGWASFGHLGEYSSMYYTYQYDKVIALDFYRQFNAADPLAGDTAMRYRKTVLEPGGSQPAADLVKNFLGRPQDVAVVAEWMSEEFAGPK